MTAIMLRRHGGPEELAPDTIDVGEPGPGQVLVDVRYAGVNFMDTGVRSGTLWRDRTPPFVPGVEGSGVVAAVGAGVTDLKSGDRVAWVYAPGSYASRLIAPAPALVPIPGDIADDVAAAAMMQGLTASHIATRFYATQAGDIALIHAAAGGLGSLLTGLVKMRGGTVIGRVSSEGKVAAARRAGADHVIVDVEGNFAKRVADLTDGKGVNVVFDGSGATTFEDSLASLRPLGTLAYFGPVLGAPPPINVATLKKSVKVGFPIFSDSLSTREDLLARSSELFEWIRSGALKIVIGNVYPLSEAAQAHADLESRATVGKLLLRVS
jgi:NADPH2:quinone reductase